MEPGVSSSLAIQSPQVPIKKVDLLNAGLGMTCDHSVQSLVWKAEQDD